MDMYKLGRSRTCNLRNLENLYGTITEQTSWPDGAPPLLHDGQAEEVDRDAYVDGIVSWIEAASSKTIELRLPDVKGTLKPDAIRARLTDMLPERVKTKGQLSSGDHRFCVLLLAEITDRPVGYKVPIKKSNSGVLDPNVINNNFAKLTDVDMVPMIIRLMDSGDVTAAKDLQAYGLKHGKAQYIFNKAYLVRQYGFDVADVCRLPDTGPQAAVKVKNADDPAQAFRAALDGLGDKPVKALTGRAIRELVKTCRARDAHDVAMILEAVADGDAAPILQHIGAPVEPDADADS